MIQENSSIPAFQGIDHEGKSVSLQDFLGRKLVLYFYPKDDTPGCTIEACGFRDAYETLRASGAEIVGVSKDSVQSHQKFRAKHELPFSLIADLEGKLCDLFGVMKEKSMYGKTYLGIERSTFLIDEKGTLRKIWSPVSVPGHIDEVIDAVRHLV